jgi:tyrosinase
MPDDAVVTALRLRGDALFRSLYNRRPVAVDPDAGGRQLTPVDADPNAVFSGFDRAHEATALALTRRFVALVAERPEADGLAAVLDAAEAELGTQNSDLVKYALAVFVTNHPVGRNLYIPRAVDQSPEMFVPSHPGMSPASPALGGLGPEAQLDYFREDPDFNAHHGQWHNVYPFGGVPDPDDPLGPPILKDRQGELFWYMHQQMLARYDTERIARPNLGPVAPFDDYAALLPEGYDADPILGIRFQDRAPDRRISTIVFGVDGGGQLDVGDLAAHEQRLAALVQAGTFTPDVAGANLLAATLEATIGAVPIDDDVAASGGLHNVGHGFFSALSPSPGGVMRSTATAVRDPVFYRWHRHIDDLFVRWQGTLPPHDLAPDAPPVGLRKDATGRSTDIGLALVDDLAAGVGNGTEFDGATFGATTFGGALWDTPIAECPGGRLTTELTSTIGRYDLQFANGQTFPIFHLDHAEFAYFFRLENSSDAAQRVTVRVFLAAAEHADDRRWWIEMDKFLHPLEPRERAVVYRPARLSSVVRKPARRPDEPAPGPTDPNDDYCNCGWPYHMLLPRGREDGMPFRLLVVVTDAYTDMPQIEQRCGSVSFCGSRDSTFPDNRGMGYPFDRPFPAPRTIADTIADAALTTVAALDITVRHRPAG